VRIDTACCNSRGFADGGVIAALADNAMGHSAVGWARRDLGPGIDAAVTVGLSPDFLGSAARGDWLEVKPVVVRTGRTLAFAECRIMVGERLVARGNATFRMLSADGAEPNARHHGRSRNAAIAPCPSPP